MNHIKTHEIPTAEYSIYFEFEWGKMQKFSVNSFEKRQTGKKEISQQTDQKRESTYFWTLSRSYHDCVSNVEIIDKVSERMNK